MLYTIVVQGRPVPQPRHDTFKNEKTGKQRHVFNTKRVNAWKALISLKCAAGMMPRAEEGPVTVDAIFRFIRPKSHYAPDGCLRDKFKDDRVSLGQTGAQACGDGDNLEKAVLDALQAKGVYLNDIQVWDFRRKSYWTQDPELEGVTIRLWTDGPFEHLQKNNNEK